MIEYIEGNIFDSPAQVIVNTVNTVGVMGKGLALAFKQRYPEMFKKYRTACEKNLLTTGKLMLFYEPDHWLLLFPTKENWRNPSRLEYIEKGLMKFVSTYAEKNITSIAFPRLGCGNGELSWSDVKPLMEKYLKALPIDVYIYLGTNPDDEPEHIHPSDTLDWLKANAKDMSFNGVRDDIIITTSILPYELKAFESTYNVKYEDGLVFKEVETNEIVYVTEDSFYAMWDAIRSQSVFKTNSTADNASLTYSLLNALGYLSKIRILDTKTEQMVNGYQINEGFARVYSLKEI